MRAVVTVLRAPVGSLASAAAATVEYLCGPAQPSLLAAKAVGSRAPGAYYADQTCDGPGRWVGNGADRFGLRGPVDRSDLETLLRGHDPGSGDALLGARGSNRRATAGRVGDRAVTWDQSEYTFRDAAALIGVDASHLRRVAGRTRALLARTGGDAATLATLESDGRAFLIAHQGDDGYWRVTHDELLRFATTRRPANVVIGYDVTFSVPKSISIVAADVDPQTQATIRKAFEQAVDVGVAYLERAGTYVGRGADRVRSEGLTAAAFTHETSRRLDPQLHTHVVIANVTETPSGAHRALDGSGLFAHAKTAAYLAGATLRRELTTRLGLEWRPVRSGIIEVAGVPQAAIDEMSARRDEIDALAAELGVTTPVGRRELARRSRAPKQADTVDGLRGEWATRLIDAGFDDAARAACVGRVPGPVPILEAETTDLFRRLVRHDGLTATSSTFTRGDVIQAMADWSIDRLDATSIERLADTFLRSPPVLALVPARGRVARGLTSTGASAGAGEEPRYTTRVLVDAELGIVTAHQRGVRADAGLVPAPVLRHALDGTSLGADQRDAVRRLCSSGDRVQCLVGPAGSGKTHTLRVAAQAWNSSRHAVRGVSVQGTAAENLEVVTGIPSTTLAALLAAADRADPQYPVLDTGSVVVLDEASTVGTFDLARLIRLVERADAKLVLVGDPAQHSAVAAGGALSALVRRHPHRTCTLQDERRQTGTEMTVVRAALDDLRRRDTDTGLHRLVVDQRVHDAPSRADAYDAIVADWYADRVARREDSTRLPSCMITEGHAARRALIARARVVLQGAGELTGDALVAGRQVFQAGDEVMCRAPARDLYPAQEPALHIRNGTLGRVVDVHSPTDTHDGGLWVDFQRRGRVFVPTDALEREIRPGITGVLTHSYALTSHAAQGATFEVARALTTEATSPAGLYVAASRGRRDVRLYTTHHELDPDAEPSAASRHNDRSGLQAVVQSLRTKGDECLAVELDPTLAGRVQPDAVLRDPFPPTTSPAAVTAPTLAIDVAPPVAAR